MNMRVVSGIQPSGAMQLGNYLGAIKNWLPLQDKHQCLFFLADLHTITIPQDPEELRRNVISTAATYLASGLDPKKSTLFSQSNVTEHAELGWILSCMTSIGWLERMTQFKDKGGDDKARASLGLLSYPVLQSADVLIYKADLVPVGEDQRQHIELTRDLGQRFNSKYKEVFTIPEAHIIKALAKINDLQEPTAKMSKSASSMAGVIELLDAPEVTLKKFKSSVTDAGREVKFDASEKAGISNLLTIHSAFSGKSISDLENEFAGKGYGDFKVAVAEVVIAALDPIRKQTEELMNDKGELLKILKDGADKANAVANKTLAETYSALGLISHG